MAQKNQYESDDYLDQLSMEQLEELLRADFASSDPENEQAVFHILEVMEKREKENPTGRLPDTDQAWKEFQQYYNIPEGEGQSLYPVRSDPETQPAPTSTKRSRRFRPRPLVSMYLEPLDAGQKRSSTLRYLLLAKTERQTTHSEKLVVKRDFLKI